MKQLGLLSNLRMWGRCEEVILCVFALKWILQNPYAEGGRSLGVVRGIIGCLLCMNVCRTFVTGVGKSLMMTKIAFYGLVVKELYN